MPICEDHLKHWGLGKGEKASNHKYYAREEVSGSGTSGNKYKYFYTKEAFDKFKSGVKGVAQEAKKNFSSYKDNWASGASQISNKVKSATNSYKNAYSSGTKQITNKVKSAANSYKTAYSSGLSTLDQKGRSIVDALNKTKKAVTNNKYVKYYKAGLGIKNGDTSLASVDDSKDMKTLSRGGEGSHKYVAKVKLSNGKTRYFYDQKQYQRWMQIAYYQNTEPKSFKKIPEIEPDADGNYPTTMQDSAKVNRNGNEGDQKNRWVNCVYCSLAMEMRKRGYDVEAPNEQSTKTTNATQLWYKGLDIKTAPAKLTSEESLTYGKLLKRHGQTYEDMTVFEENDNVKCVTNFKDYYKSAKSAATGEISTDSESRMNEYAKNVEKSMADKIDDFPNGARGYVNMYWLGGGGHSIYFEKDGNGKITYVDAQSNKEIDIKDYAKSFNPYAPTAIIRTDNLQLDWMAQRNVQWSGKYTEDYKRRHSNIDI